MLSRERTCRWLAEAIATARRRLAFRLWAYVFIPEPVHLLTHPGDRAYRMKVILWRIKRPVGCKAPAFLEHHAPQWLLHLTVPRSDGIIERRFGQAGGGYDRNSTDPDTARQGMDYIHHNPVRRGLVRSPEEWFWSSARCYAGIRPVPLDIDPPML